MINLKKDAAFLTSQLEETNCEAGDVLYFAETQLIGFTQHTTAMVSAQVCDFRYQVIPFSLQNTVSTICIFSGGVLQLGGSRVFLKQVAFTRTLKTFTHLLETEAFIFL